MATKLKRQVMQELAIPDGPTCTGCAALGKVTIGEAGTPRIQDQCQVHMQILKHRDGNLVKCNECVQDVVTETVTKHGIDVVTT